MKTVLIKRAREWRRFGKMEMSTSMVGLGCVMISLGIVLLLLSLRPIDSEIIKSSQELRRARQLWRVLQHRAR